MTKALLNSKDLTTTWTVTLSQVRRHLARHGGYRENHALAVSFEFPEQSTNTLDVYAEHDEFLCSVGIDDNGKLTICG
jgi:hypothetical protein